MFWKTPSRWIVAAALALAVPVAAAPRAVIIKLGTQAPQSSSWYDALQSMGAKWKADTGGRVELRVFAIPSDSEGISRMSPLVNGLQAATLFVAGLSEIDPAFNVFGIPFFFESDAELDFVQKELAPMLQQRLAAKQYRLINWGNGGWVRLFSKAPLKSIADIQGAKLYTTNGDDKTVQWYQKQGFHAVPTTTSQIPQQLMNPVGTINAAPSPPVYALATGIFKHAKYMLDLRLGPFTAATVMTEKAWAQISADDQKALMAAAAAMQQQVNTKAPTLDSQYIDEMKKAGLNVVTLDATALAAFNAKATELIQTQRGTLVPTEAFDAAVRAREAFRKGKR
jgi:TRAP-type C4-dicarboxylate transport system substrate-binding protein